jgi:hypothetical protein
MLNSKIVSVHDLRMSPILIIQLDRTALTMQLIDRALIFFDSHLKEVLTFKDIARIGEYSIIDLVSECDAILTVEPCSKEYTMDAPTIKSIPLAGEVAELPSAQVLIFCGHSNYSGGLTSYLTKELLEAIIFKVEPTVISFFGCDVGRPRDGFIFELSHSHDACTGPIYAGFTRKVSVDDVLDSAIMHGIKQFADWCIRRALDNDKTGAPLEGVDGEESKLLTDDVIRSADDLPHSNDGTMNKKPTDIDFAMAQISFALAIKRKTCTAGDSGTFFNDARKLTTAQSILTAIHNEQSREVEDKLRDIARYHLWTVGLRTCTDFFISSLGDPSSIEPMYASLKINEMKALEKLIRDTALTKEIARKLAGGGWNNLQTEEVCIGVYNGLWGKQSFQNVISIMYDKLVLAKTKTEYNLVAATLILIDESSYASFVADEFCIYRDQCYYPFVEQQTGSSTFQFDPVESFSLDSFLASLASLYYFCKLRNDFKELLRDSIDAIQLVCGESLKALGGRNMSPRPPFRFTKVHFDDILNAVTRHIAHISALRIADRLSALKSHSYYNDIRVAEFCNVEGGDGGMHRFPIFPQHFENEELFFLVVYPLSTSNLSKLYRCRFLAALPKRVLTSTIAQLRQIYITGLLYYTDSHYGQDVYATDTSKQNIKLDAHDTESYNWVANRDYSDVTSKICFQKGYFPCDYIGKFRCLGSTCEFCFDDETDPPFLW